MDSALDRLIRAIPPPVQLRPVVEDWTRVERRLGIQLPDDYKTFISTYGTGSFEPFELCVWNFLTQDIDVNFILRQNDFATDAESKSISLLDMSTTTPVLPWGVDGMGSEFLWARDREPENWYVIVVKGGLVFHQFVDVSLTEFLVELFVDKSPRLVKLWAASVFSVEHQFVSST